MSNDVNKLIKEKSPYLLQHAHNPVNWYPWEEEAFQKAHAENKPIFLSIGYSTCHWCHVMAHESFEDNEVAAILNERYVAIKVDREERPDIDSVYMKVCQMMTGHGGWPLTIIMTPDKIPFYAGTYFPKDSKHGLPGIIEMLTQLHMKYKEDREHIADIAKNVEEALKQTKQTKSENTIHYEAVQQTYDQLLQKFDPKFGGFGPAPKFPQPQNLLFLLDYYYFTKDETALQMVETTLQQMTKGGIYDQIGYGFSRYSTDEAWLVPHFEKMLYDNAMLLYAFAICFQITHKPCYKNISEHIIDFITREMVSDRNVFYSAIDADSEGVEGKYYVWDYEEILSVLGEDKGEEFADIFGITPAGNFEGKNIPNLIHHEDFFSNQIISPLIDSARKQLLEVREKRVYPHVDDKILSGWNSMMITALAKAGVVFDHQGYVTMAKNAMTFIEIELFNDKRLLARYRDGEAKYLAYLDDYAFLIWGCIELYEATYELSYLEKAKKYTDAMIRLFWDEEHGGFFQSGSDSETLISREKEIYDGALPSGNGVAANVLMRLGSLTGVLKYKDMAETMRSSFYEDINNYSSAAAFFMKSLFTDQHSTKEVVVIGEVGCKEKEKFLRSIRSTFLPNVSVLVAENAKDFQQAAPFAADYKQLNEQTTFYICENFACQQPTNNTKTAIQQLNLDS